MNRHATNYTALMCGLLFVILGGLLGLESVETIDLDLRWLPAALFLGVGAAAVLGGLTDRQR